MNNQIVDIKVGDLVVPTSRYAQGVETGEWPSRYINFAVGEIIKIEDGTLTMQIVERPEYAQLQFGFFRAADNNENYNEQYVLIVKIKC